LFAPKDSLGELSCRHAEMHEEASLLQVDTTVSREARSRLSTPTARDLVFMHVPYNFGHTVEMVALMIPSMIPDITDGTVGAELPGGKMPDINMTWELLEKAKPFQRPDREIWGHLNPDLLVTSNVTGCGMYFTPQKYWPDELAQKYFGNKKVFGVLRDPYERLVALFRGDIDGYGGSYPEFKKTCDVNGAVKSMLLNFLNGTDPFAQGCTFIPQAEYFDSGKYSIVVPVDNRRFPESMNERFKEHGYEDMHIETSQVVHVRGCDNVWAADLDSETKTLVRKVYAKDFALLCKHFNYCDDTENVCLTKVPHMCPEKAFKWNDDSKEFTPK